MGGGMGGGMSRRRGTGGGNICMYILAILLPPLAVFFESGCGGAFCVNVILTMIGWIPGIIHAFYIIMTRSSSSRAMAY